MLKRDGAGGVSTFRSVISNLRESASQSILGVTIAIIVAVAVAAFALYAVIRIF